MKPEYQTRAEQALKAKRLRQLTVEFCPYEDLSEEAIVRLIALFEEGHQGADLFAKVKALCFQEVVSSPNASHISKVMTELILGENFKH